MESDDHQSKEETLVQDRIDERLVPEPCSEVKVLSEKQNLCEDKRIDKRKGMLPIVQVAATKRNSCG